MENATSSSQNNVGPQSNVRPEIWPIESQEQLIQVSKENLYKKVSSKWKDCLLLVMGLVITASIFSLLVYVALTRTGSANICTTPECIRSASNLLEAMNASADPCDNFYKFTCDNWRHEHVMEEPRFINNWFEERSKLIKRDIIDYLELENSEDEPIPVHQARTIYQACLDIESMNANGLDALWGVLNRTGLPRLPLGNPEPHEDWVRSMARVRRFLGMDILVGFTVMTSLRNSTQNQLAIATTQDNDMFLRKLKWSDISMETALDRNLQKGNLDVIRLWKDFSVKVMKFLAQKSNYTAPHLDRDIARVSLRILQIKQNLTEIEGHEDVMGPFLNDIPDEMELDELQELVDNSSISGSSKLNWETYFTSLFEDVDVDLSFPDDKILVYKRVYFELLAELFDYLSEKDLELILWWDVVYTLAPHVHEELKTLKDIYTTRALSAAQPDSRPGECAGLVYKFMDSAIGFLSVTTFNTSLVDDISAMILNIQKAFVESVSDLSWMDESTRKATMEKIMSIRTFIGIPDWIADKEELESMYNITVDASNHLENLLTIMNAQVLDILYALRIENNSSISQFNPLDINAYYDPSGNAISVPAAVMQFPFYDLGLESLNYGAIGTILGHEMTHALDSYGRRFDLHGNLNNNWWTNESTVEYEKRTECFVQSYSSYVISPFNGTVDGNTTLAENLADDGGLRNAFLAYVMYTNNFDYVEPKLPGLEKYSQKQLFFIAHGNMWCTEYTDESLRDTLDYDEHSPPFVRVNRVLQNMPEFAKAWNCPVGSKMNPDDKCKLWLD